MSRASRLPPSVVAAIDRAKIIGVRAGARTDHRFIGIWAVVVGGRVYARSWTRTRGGWYRTFLEDPVGALEVEKRHVRVRAVRRGGARLWTEVERAYAAKYPTPGSQKYVRGFRTTARRATTVEFVPR
jgi:hypothetical protein